jgi:hypothetical protein
MGADLDPRRRRRAGSADATAGGDDVALISE